MPSSPLRGARVTMNCLRSIAVRAAERPDVRTHAERSSFYTSLQASGEQGVVPNGLAEAARVPASSVPPVFPRVFKDVPGRLYPRPEMCRTMSAERGHEEGVAVRHREVRLLVARG